MKNGYDLSDWWSVWRMFYFGPILQYMLVWYLQSCISQRVSQVGSSQRRRHFWRMDVVETAAASLTRTDGPTDGRTDDGTRRNISRTKPEMIWSRHFQVKSPPPASSHGYRRHAWRLKSRDLLRLSVCLSVSSWPRQAASNVSDLTPGSPR